MEGQTVREGIEGIIKHNGIDFGAFRAGDIEGNGCQNQMRCVGDITKSMTEILQSMVGGKKNAATRRLVSCSGRTCGCWAIWRPSFKDFARNGFI